VEEAVEEDAVEEVEEDCLAALEDFGADLLAIAAIAAFTLFPVPLVAPSVDPPPAPPGATAAVTAPAAAADVGMTLTHAGRGCRGRFLGREFWNPNSWKSSILKGVIFGIIFLYFFLCLNVGIFFLYFFLCLNVWTFLISQNSIQFVR